MYVAKGTYNYAQSLCEILTVRTDNLATMVIFYSLTDSYFFFIFSVISVICFIWNVYLTGTKSILISILSYSFHLPVKQEFQCQFSASFFFFFNSMCFFSPYNITAASTTIQQKLAIEFEYGEKILLKENHLKFCLFFVFFFAEVCICFCFTKVFHS